MDTKSMFEGQVMLLDAVYGGTVWIQGCSLGRGYTYGAALDSRKHGLLKAMASLP